jgi:hypothetical protein
MGPVEEVAAVRAAVGVVATCVALLSSPPCVDIIDEGEDDEEKKNLNNGRLRWSI